MRRFSGSAVILLMVTLFSAGLAWPYGNDDASGVGPHRRINELSLRKFIDKAQKEKDPVFSKYYFLFEMPGKPLTLENFVPPLGADQIKGTGDAFLVINGNTVTKKGDWEADISESEAWHSFTWWVTEGGYTADEPETFMALRHFYDPVKANGAPYLTDDIDRWLSYIAGYRNPKMDLFDWGFFQSNYSYTKGMKSYKDALSARAGDYDAQKQRYAFAWRALGESMHLLADLTCPAHVRNDAHPGQINGKYDELVNFKNDPYEAYVTASVVEEDANGKVDPVIEKFIKEYDNAGKLFQSVAGYTNRYYFSTDTISGKTQDGRELKSFNGMPDYPSPKLEKCIYDAGTGYYCETGPSGESIKMAFAQPNGRATVTKACAMSQAPVLIPVAIAANVKLLYIYLPKLAVVIDEISLKDKKLLGHIDEYKFVNEGKYSGPNAVAGFPTSSKTGILFITFTWDDGKERKANYFVEIIPKEGGKFEIDLAKLNDEKLDAYLKKDEDTRMMFQPAFTLGVDIGGILVKSDEFPKLRIEPRTAIVEKGAKEVFKAVYKAGSGGGKISWNVKESEGGSITGDGEYTAPDKSGDYHIVAELLEDGISRTAEAAVTVKEGEDKAAGVNTVSADMPFSKAVELYSMVSYPQEIGKLPQFMEEKYGYTYYGFDFEYQKINGRRSPNFIRWSRVIGRGPCKWNGVDSSYVAFYDIGVRMSLRAYDFGAESSLYEHDVKSGFSYLPEKFNFTDKNTGEHSLGGLTDRNGTLYSWVGPFRMDVEVYLHIGVDRGDYFDSSFDDRDYKKLSDAIGADLLEKWRAGRSDEAVRMGRIIWSEFLKWYKTPIYPGPGFKGLYWPLNTKYYTFKPNGLSGLAVDGEVIRNDSIYCRLKAKTQGYRTEQYDIQMDAFGPSYDDKSATTPIDNAIAKMKKQLEEKKKSDRIKIEGEKRLTLNGADEAYEFLFTYSEWKGYTTHYLIFRRGNVVVSIIGEGYDKEKATSPKGLELAKYILDRMVKEKKVDWY